MELIQKGIVTAIIAGGAGAVGYYTINGSKRTTLLEYVTSKKREVISDDTGWQAHDTPYKNAKPEDQISGVEPRDRTKTKLWQIIKKWCNSTGSKVFTNLHDDTYQKFSIWCLKPKKLVEVLKDEELEETSDWDARVTGCKGKDLDCSFIPVSQSTPPPKPKESKTELQKTDIENWCKKEKEQQFRHEMDQAYIRVKKICFISKEESKSPAPSTRSA